MRQYVVLAAWVAIAAMLTAPRCVCGAALSSDTAEANAAARDVSPSQAFLEGYRAYQRHDLATAESRLSYAASHFPTLADYALFYLGLAERDRKNLAQAEQTLAKLIARYPQSVTVPRAALALAQVRLELGMPARAARAAQRAIAVAPGGSVEQAARFELSRALVAEGDDHAAYDEAMALRLKYPRGSSDAAARKLAYSILASDPQIAHVASPPYHRDEAALLLAEAEPALALSQVHAGLALSPAPPLHAQFVFLKARALRSSPASAEAAFKQYLQIAPEGPLAAQATQALALIYWNENLRERARATFARLVARFPQSTLAPGAMLRIGRILEEEKKFDAARGEYLRLIARYPRSQAADAARFRAPWTYYMTGRYALAAKGFRAGRVRASAIPGQRARFAYWQARSLERSGKRRAAEKIYLALAECIDSNYYPALAARRVHAPRPVLPAAALPDPSFDAPPRVPKPAAFHVERVLALDRLGLRELEPPELQALAKRVAGEPALGDFVLAGFQRSDAYYDAIVAASRMERRGELGHDAAERVRYPRGYWHLITTAAARNHLDPYLVLALVRQESWFNPKAVSSCDARGLMQLLPATAKRLGRKTTPPAVVDLYDPRLNVKLGTRELARLLALFHGNEVRAIAAYNAGERAVQGWIALFGGTDDEWVENIGFRETRNYVKQVIGGVREYRLLYPSHPSGRASAQRPRLAG